MNETMTNESSNALHCECGEWTGQSCEWRGPGAETVVVEYMPPQYRASHTAARNHGTYPMNGAVRVTVARKCADQLFDLDAEREWARTVADD